MREVGSPIGLVRKMTWEDVIQPTLEDAVPVALTDIELKQSAIASAISDVNPATFVSTFITNQVMFPNGHAVTAGRDRHVQWDLGIYGIRQLQASRQGHGDRAHADETATQPGGETRRPLY